MANIMRGNGGSGLQRDPFALARELLSWDPFFRLDFPSRIRTEQSTFVPSFNVVERNDAYHITADVPGVSEEDIDVTVQDNYLVISGSRKAEERKEGENYYVYERRYGNFSRSFALPDNADPDSIEADMKDGVLELRIAKRESARPRKVPLGQRMKQKLTGEKQEKQEKSQ
ncbi:MAG TPA: Hsp20/alpha crystallin family protein [Kofleriaceae bacterium]|nr:Hsp20/alpha crystallin family protein [Kofleriaceae bacterium]